MVVLKLELSNAQAALLREFVAATMVSIIEGPNEDMAVPLFKILSRIKTQLPVGGDNESGQGTGRTLRSARRLS